MWVLKGNLKTKDEKLISLIFISSYLLFIQSCKVMYTPNMQNVPLFKEKKELRATVGFNDAQLAYAITDNIGIMANLQHKKPTWTSTTTTNGIQGAEFNYESEKNLIEAGIGYFKIIEESLVFEVYAGGAVGNIMFKRNYSQAPGAPSTLVDKYSANTSRFFIQPTIGYTDEHLDVALSTRFVALKFSGINTYGFTPNYFLEENRSGLEESFYTFFEPALTSRVGWKYVKLHLQAFLSLQLNNKALNYNPFGFNVGIHINIAQRHKEY